MRRFVAYMTLSLTMFAAGCFAKHEKPANECFGAPDENTCAIENNVFTETNKYRAKMNVRPLKWSSEIGFAAREWSDFQTSLRTTSHYGFPYLRQSTIHWNYPRTTFILKGENVAHIEYCRRAVSSCIIEQWKDDPGYTQNLLNKKYTHMGVGVATWNTTYATAIFGM